MKVIAIGTTGSIGRRAVMNQRGLVRCLARSVPTSTDPTATYAFSAIQARLHKDL